MSVNCCITDISVSAAIFVLPRYANKVFSFRARVHLSYEELVDEVAVYLSPFAETLFKLGGAMNLTAMSVLR